MGTASRIDARVAALATSVVISCLVAAWGWRFVGPLPQTDLSDIAAMLGIEGWRLRHSMVVGAGLKEFVGNL